jgi:ribosome recycling factor
MIEEFKKELQKFLAELKERLKGIRSHKLSLGRLEPFDPNSLKEIEIAILERKMNLTVIKEKNSLVIKFPPLTEEAKKEILRELRSLKEEFRIKGRLKRDEFLKKFREDKEQGKISEDSFHKTKENLDKEIEKFNQEVENIFQQKEKEIL